VPFSRIPEISSALNALLRAAGPPGLQWVVQALTLLPEASVSQADKQALLGGRGKRNENMVLRAGEPSREPSICLTAA
jgi:hypothetical protein